MPPIRSLIAVVGSILIAVVPLSAAAVEKLTGMPLYPGSTPVSASPVDMRMSSCNSNFETKGYRIPNGTVAKLPAWFSRAMHGARQYPYTIGGQSGIAIFNPSGDGFVHIEPSPSERFIKSVVIYYRASPPLQASRFASFARGGC